MPMGDVIKWLLSTRTPPFSVPRRRSKVWVSKKNPGVFGSDKQIGVYWATESKEITGSQSFSEWLSANYILRVVEWVE